MKKHVVVIGAGLCGSVISTLLRNHFKVTVIEQGRKKRPLYNELQCEAGEINTSINRAEGLGGTTNYWHNALIELTASDLKQAGINPGVFNAYYSRAWAFFLSEEERKQCDAIGVENSLAVKDAACTAAHMVVPYNRVNVWQHANAAYPGDEIEIVYGHAEKILASDGNSKSTVQVHTDSGPRELTADYTIVCGGGLATPTIIMNSLAANKQICGGYHDHPMAYVAKLQLKTNSKLKTISCRNTPAMDVRTGFVYESAGIKAAFYLRPAQDMSLKSICGPARYILSDLRNNPLSIRKMLQLLSNLDAVKEAILFKMKIGFKGDYYSVLMLGEQQPMDGRGIQPGNLKPSLNWHVTAEEHAAYASNFKRFLADFEAEIADTNALEPYQWEYRTAAHHSGTAFNHLTGSDTMELPFFEISQLPNTFACDASVLHSGGIANSGLTLVALANRLADLMIHSFAGSDESTGMQASAPDR